MTAHLALHIAIDYHCRIAYTLWGIVVGQLVQCAISVLICLRLCLKYVSSITVHGRLVLQSLLESVPLSSTVVCFVAKTEKLTTNKNPPKKTQSHQQCFLIGHRSKQSSVWVENHTKNSRKTEANFCLYNTKKNKQNLFRRKQPQNYFEQAKEDCAVFLAFYSNGESSTSGSRAPFPQHFFKIMQFSGNFKGPPHFEQLLGSGPPLGVKTLLDHSLIFVPNVT